MIKLSVRRPMTVLVAVLLVIVLGFVSFTNMKTDLLPGFDMPYVAVITQYPGASPEKVEKEVTKVVESTLATTGGVENVTSVSSENLSMVMLELTYGTDMNSAIIDMSQKLETAKSLLGEEVRTPTLMQINPDMIPVIVAAADIDGKDIYETSDFVKKTLVPAIEKVDGVASVSTIGVVEKSIKVTLDQTKIDELNNKILASVDKKLSETEKQLSQAKTAIDKAQKEFIAQSTEQTQKLLDTQKDLEKKLADAENSKSSLEDALKKANENLEQITSIPQTPETEAAASQLRATIAEYQSQIYALEVAITNMKDGLSQTEIAKVELSKKLSVAEMELADKKSEYEKGKKEFDNARDEAYKSANINNLITSDTIKNILAASNFEMPAGYLTENGEQYAVKVGDRFKSTEEIKKLELFNITQGDIGIVTLEDIATLENTDNSSEMYAKINGNDGIMFVLQKQSTASTSEVSNAVHKALDKVQKDNNELHVTYLNDQGIYIDIVTGTVMENLGLGAILAIIILFIFLRNIRPTFIVALSIPISVLLAVVLMYFTGVNLNVISLGGLALGIGMLVDNSIVVIENIYRMRIDGVPAAKAAVRGAAEVSGAILASTLTTICVFLPIVFIQGLSRELFADMGLTIAYSLLASLIIALTVVPAASANMIKKNPKPDGKVTNRIRDFYEKTLSGALRFKFIPLVLSLILFGAAVYGTLKMGLSFIPETNSDKLTVTVEPEKGTSVEDARALSDKIISRINEIDGVQTVGAMQGSSYMGMPMSGSSVDISMYVVLTEKHPLTSAEVASEIENITSDLPCKVTASGNAMNMAALSGSGLDIIIKGDDLNQLQKIASDIAELVSQTDGTEEVSDGNEDADMQTHITVDKNKALSYGLTVAQVYSQVSQAIKNQTTASTLTLENESFDLIVAKPQNEQLTRETLKSIPIDGTKDGQNISVILSDIAQISESTTPSAINHENSVRYMNVTAKIKDGSNIALVSRDVETKLENYEVPDGYKVEIVGENETITSSVKDLIKMVLLAIVLIYLIMVAVFQSVSSPFIVMFTIPLAFTGGILALWAFGFEISVISMLGLLVLSGVVVNNGIVFVDRINQLRLEGMPRREAILEAGKSRLRPIFMTALTTILGLLTLAFGFGTGADLLQPMAIVLIFGLLYATLLTLYVVPCLYDLFKRKDLKKIDID